MKEKKRLAVLVVILVILVALFLGLGLTPSNYAYALSRRIPKVLAILLTGSAIAFSSVIFQTVTGNRILTPSVLGLDSLYVLLQTVTIFVLGSGAAAKLSGSLNFLASVVLMAGFSVVILGSLLRKAKSDIYFLLLAGIIAGTLFRSASTFMQAILDPNEFLIVQGKLFASFNNMSTGLLSLAAILLVLAMGWGLKSVRELDVFSLGRDHAVNLGVDDGKLVSRMLLITAVLVSVSTALVGPLIFLGVLVTNLAREMLSTYKHSYLLPGSMLIASIALVFSQLLVERVLSNETPVSVLINFAGGAYFIYLLLKENRL